MPTFDPTTFAVDFESVDPPGGVTPPIVPTPETVPGVVYDPFVFDVGVFDALYSVPFMQKCVVGRGYKRLVAGSTVPVTLHIQEGDTTPGRLFSMNPDSVQVQVYYPDGSVRVGYSHMTNRSLGIYSYHHTTFTYDPRGCYRGNFKMVSGDKVTITEPQLFFEVV